jgi:DNA-binding transcriptional ArsR family regulator
VRQATISHHLKELASAGLVESRRDGQFVFYRVRPTVLDAYMTELRRRTVPSVDAAAKDLKGAKAPRRKVAAARRG